MWNIDSIELTNLFSNKHTEYKLNNNICTVIFGENHTDNGMTNNGAGKTTLFEAICIALTNESLRSIRKESFINRDEDFCFVSLSMTNNVHNISLVIKRTFYRSNKPVKVELIENGVLNTQIVSVLEANKRVFELIGITKDDLLRYFIISQDNNYTFFNASDADKKEIMNRITSADMINPLLNNLSEMYHEKQANFDVINTRVSKLSERIETLKEQRQDLINNDNTDERIRDIESRIGKNELTIENDKRSIAFNHDEEKRLLKDIDVINVEEDVSDLKDKRNKIKKDIEHIESDVIDNKRVKRNLESELEDTIECPKCGYEFMHNTELENLTVEDAKKLLKQTDKELSQQKDKIELLNNSLTSVNNDIERVLKLLDKKSKLEFELKNLNRKNQSLQADIDDCNNRINRHKNDIVDIENNRGNNDALKSIDVKIKECEDEIKIKNKELKPLENDINIIKFWQFNMGKSGFMTYLANKSVKIIEGVTNNYLRKFGVDMSVIINGFKILKSGDVREKIDVFITNDGITEENFLSKSGGERGRVTLAGILGIQHLINLSTNGNGLNLLILDEALSGIDTNGTMEIINTLNKLNITVLMITQNIEDVSICKNYIRVVKENNISSIQ